MRKERNYSLRSPADKSWFENETWCDNCQKADLGLVEPHEYEEDGRVFIEGKCRQCRNQVVSEIIVEKVSE